MCVLYFILVLPGARYGAHRPAPTAVRCQYDHLHHPSIAGESPPACARLCPSVAACGDKLHRERERRGPGPRLRGSASVCIAPGGYARGWWRAGPPRRPQHRPKRLASAFFSLLGGHRIRDEAIPQVAVPFLVFADARCGKLGAGPRLPHGSNPIYALVAAPPPQEDAGLRRRHASNQLRRPRSTSSRRSTSRSTICWQIWSHQGNDGDERLLTARTSAPHAQSVIGRQAAKDMGP